jgi:hypothetical protein
MVPPCSGPARPPAVGFPYFIVAPFAGGQAAFGHLPGGVKRAVFLSAAIGMVALHAGLVTLEVAGMFIFWHFAEQAEHENEVLARQAGEARRAVERAEQESRERAAEELRLRSEETATSVQEVNQVISAIVAETEDVAQTFASTTGAVDDIHELQLNNASSVEEQASVLAEVITQLSAATATADQVLAGLQTLSASTGR